MSKKKALQDLFPEVGSLCFGCGRNNEQGLQIKSYCEGDECICTFHAKSHHIAYPGVGCGGIISTILDCHCINTAMYVAYKKENREVGTKPDKIYATASLTVNFLKPAPIDAPWVFKAQVSKYSERRIHVICRIYANEKEIANGIVIAAHINQGNPTS
ncbi:MAG: PaaI family thioesterase [Candidatus Lokiarchaeota archaeon]|nr:PaaI family thioesterase [Candidatus Lokiarchaeota archaeon]